MPGGRGRRSDRARKGRREGVEGGAGGGNAHPAAAQQPLTPPPRPRPTCVVALRGGEVRNRHLSATEGTHRNYELPQCRVQMSYTISQSARFQPLRCLPLNFLLQFCAIVVLCPALSTRCAAIFPRRLDDSSRARSHLPFFRAVGSWLHYYEARFQTALISSC